VLVKSVKSNISFKRALAPNEMGRFSAVCDEAKKLVGQTGKSIFIVHDACLPQSEAKNTGVGNLSSDEAQAFFAYMKQYLGFNTVEVLPPGEIKGHNSFYCAYAGSALSLGNHQINPELLTTEKFNKILSLQEFNEIVSANTAQNKETVANFKNVTGENSALEIALKKAFKRFMELDGSTELKKSFEAYKAENNDWLEPKSVFKILEKKYGTDDYTCWGGIDGILYDPYVKEPDRIARIAQILKENPDETEFYKFKQFLADSHLAIGRKKLNSLGVSLTGDCEIGFSKDEVWANPKAFIQGAFIGDKDWAAPCLDFDSIKNGDITSESAKLLKRKVQLCAKRYDSIRFDVGWAYFKPIIYHYNGNVQTKNLGNSVLSFIEQSVKEIKGQNYDLNNLIYEFQGGDIFDSTGNLYEPVKKRVKVFDSVFMKDNAEDIWGSNNAYLKRGWAPDEFVIGVGNHDSQPLRQIANNIKDTVPADDGGYHKKLAADALAKIFGIDRAKLDDPVEFAKAKWAEPMMAKNNMMFYADVFARQERFNMHHENLTVHPERNFALKIPFDYEKAYHKGIQEGFGFNIMDSFEKIFKTKGLDKTQPELYAEIVKFRDILNEGGSAAKSTRNLKNNKFIKPIILIGAAVCLIAATIMVLKKKPSNVQNKKPAEQNIQQNNTQNAQPAPAASNPSLNRVNMQNFLNSTTSKPF